MDFKLKNYYSVALLILGLMAIYYFIEMATATLYFGIAGEYGLNLFLGFTALLITFFLFLMKNKVGLIAAGIYALYSIWLLLIVFFYGIYSFAGIGFFAIHLLLLILVFKSKDKFSFGKSKKTK